MREKKISYNAHYDNLFFSPMINDLRHTFFHAPRAAPSSPCLAGFSIKQVCVPLLVVRETVGSWVVVASQWQNTAGQAVHTIASSANKTTTPHSTKGVTSLEAPDQSENAKLNEDLKTWRFWNANSSPLVCGINSFSHQFYGFSVNFSQLGAKLSLWLSSALRCQRKSRGLNFSGTTTLLWWVGYKMWEFNILKSWHPNR